LAQESNGDGRRQCVIDPFQQGCVSHLCLSMTAMYGRQRAISDTPHNSARPTFVENNEQRNVA
jgi:hypothetical protein